MLCIHTYTFLFKRFKRADSMSNNDEFFIVFLAADSLGEGFAQEMNLKMSFFCLIKSRTVCSLTLNSSPSLFTLSP